MSTLDLDGIVDVLIDIMDEYDFNEDDTFAYLDGFVQGYFDGSNGTQFYIEMQPNFIYGPAVTLNIHENRYPTSSSSSHTYDEARDWNEDELREAVQNALADYGY